MAAGGGSAPRSPTRKHGRGCFGSAGQMVSVLVLLVVVSVLTTYVAVHHTHHVTRHGQPDSAALSVVASGSETTLSEGAVSLAQGCFSGHCEAPKADTRNLSLQDFQYLEQLTLTLPASSCSTGWNRCPKLI